MKKLLILILLVVLVFTFSSNVFAQSHAYDDFSMYNKYVDYYPIEALDSLPINEALTYEEMYEKLKNLGVSDKNLLSFKKNRESIIKSDSSTVLYQTFYMKTEVVYGNMYTYKIQPRIVAGLEYLGNSTSPSRIVSLEDGFAYTGGGDSCVFDGRLRYFLEAGNSFSTVISGDVYRMGGNVSVSGGGSIGVGEIGEVNISAQYDVNSYVDNIYGTDRYYSSSLDK